MLLLFYCGKIDQTCQCEAQLPDRIGAIILYIDTFFSFSHQTYSGESQSTVGYISYTHDFGMNCMNYAGSPSDSDCVLQLDSWLTAIGYSLCYGTILAKMARVYYIFNNLP